MKKITVVSLILVQLILIGFVGSERKNVLAESTEREYVVAPTKEPMTIEEEKEYNDPSSIITSGNYTYRVVNKTRKEIELLGVEMAGYILALPEKIDGYTLVSLGIQYANLEEQHRDDLMLKGNLKENLQELIIPESVKTIGAYAFYGCEKLQKVTFPKIMYQIWDGAFEKCNISSIELPPCLVGDGAFGEVKDIVLRGTRLGESVFRGNIECIKLVSEVFDEVNLGDALAGATVKKVIVDSGMRKVYFTDLRNVGVNKIEKLFINGKSTKVEAEIVKSGESTMAFDTIYTVKKAKCISWAKKEKINHHVKSVGKMGKVTKKKVKDGYRYSWKKVKTSVEKNIYKEKYAKWKSSNYKTKTVYRIYGKEKKADEYRLLGKTEKTTYKTTCKYVKVKPVKGWS